MALPERTADTMSDAIALSSPNGRMSQRAKRAALARLGAALFGPNATREDFTGGTAPQPTERHRLLAQASRLRDLAARGMSVRKFTREADKLETQAAALPDDGKPEDTHANTQLGEIMSNAKRFSETQNVGKARYVVNFHDGVKKHDDGSDFMDVRIFKNKVLKDRFVRNLRTQGYAE